MRSPIAHDERGLAAPVVVGLTAVILLLALAAGVAGRVLVTQRRAAAAADLGALAGAVAVQRGGDACGAVSRLVARSGARVQQCEVSGDHVRVTVVAEAAVVAGRRISVAERAHAGPR